MRERRRKNYLTDIDPITPIYNNMLLLLSRSLFNSICYAMKLYTLAMIALYLALARCVLCAPHFFFVHNKSYNVRYARTTCMANEKAMMRGKWAMRFFFRNFFSLLLLLLFRYSPLRYITNEFRMEWKQSLCWTNAPAWEWNCTYKKNSIQSLIASVLLFNFGDV